MVWDSVKSLNTGLGDQLTMREAVPLEAQACPERPAVS